MLLTGNCTEVVETRSIVECKGPVGEICEKDENDRVSREQDGPFSGHEQID